MQVPISQKRLIGAAFVIFTCIVMFGGAVCVTIAQQ